MRNLAFSIMLGALAVLQIAVVLAALSSSHVQATTAETTEVEGRNVVAATDTKREAPVL